MSCKQYTTLISREIDNELSPEKRAKLKDHLAGCHECRTLWEEFKTIRNVARECQLEKAPSQNVWSSINHALIEGSQKQTKFAALFDFMASRPLQIATITACAIIIIFVLRNVPADGPLTPENQGNTHKMMWSSLSPSQEEELHYQYAISALTGDIEQKEDSLDIAMSDIVRANLLIIDRAIESYYRILEIEPQNREIQEFLSECLEKKVALLTQVISYNA